MGVANKGHRAAYSAHHPKRMVVLETKKAGPCEADLLLGKRVLWT
jgi:hypothetical protein